MTNFVCTYTSIPVNIFSQVGQMLHEVWGGARLLDVHDLYGIDSSHGVLGDRESEDRHRVGETDPYRGEEVVNRAKNDLSWGNPAGVLGKTRGSDDRV